MLDIHAHLKTKSQDELNWLLSDMDDNNIKKRVVSSTSNDPILDNIKYIEECVRKYPEKLIGCALINPKNSNSISDVDYALGSNEIEMIEFNSFEHAYYPDINDNLDKIFKKIDEKNIPVKVFTGIGCFAIPQQWEKYVVKYPKIKFIFLNMGCFDYGYTCIDVVARNSNAYIEISNQYENQIIKKALDKIETNKILFGTTYPERLTSSSVKLLDDFDISPDVKRDIYFKNNLSFLGEV